MDFVINTKISAKAAAIALAPLAFVPGGWQYGGAERGDIPVVEIAAGTFDYREPGDFSREGRPVNGPVRKIGLDRPFFIMKTQVSAASYDRCVLAGACARRLDANPAGDDLPAVGVSWRDATAFASWLSRETGEEWRLPSDAEWAVAAGSRFKDDAVSGESFVKRWLAKYDQESAGVHSLPKGAQPLGAFGVNERGVADLSGNVWEWTSTCFVRQSIDAADRAIGEPFTNCGVRIVEGEHRTYVPDFIRDARVSGCSAGIPPTNLGFRLVREEPSLLARIVRMLWPAGGQA